MRLTVRISPVEPGVYELPEQYPYAACEGEHFASQEALCAKALRDPTHTDAEAQRQRGLRCARHSSVFLTPSPTLER